MKVYNKSISILALILITSSVIFGQDWKPADGKANFTIRMLGANVDGKFGNLKANVRFSGNDPSYISATVDASTLDTDNSLRNKHLKEKEEFFQVDKYPTLTLTSTQIGKTADGKYQGTFRLTIKDVTKIIKVPFTFSESGNQGVLKSDFVINRKSWNFGGNTLGMADNVKVNLLLNVVK
jgi:polyisoprenoid-binding protein YceI